jgi:polysaccharide deacetylase 2 family uncharacterized protein YibQ
MGGGQIDSRRRRGEVARRRQVKRRNSLISAIVVFVIIALLVVVLGPWGPFRVVIYGSNGRKLSNHRDQTISVLARTINDDVTSGALSRQKYQVLKKPAIALVIDDTGNSLTNLPLWLKIDVPLSFAVMPYPPLSQKLATEFHNAGFQIMMHIPTQNGPPNTFSGTGQLSLGMSRDTVFSTLDSDLAKVPYVTGVNNHQGGAGCDDLSLMTYECEWAKSKGFYVVDSASSNHSQVTKAATSLGMGKRLNEVFIDHQNDPAYIRNAMRELAGLAKKNGYAIGICHYHRPNTPTVVGEMIRTLKAEGINFVYVKDITN